MRSLRACAFFGLGIVGVIAGACGTLGSGPAWAQDCPGNPAALGTSRVLVLDPNGPTRFGVMQYPQTLPLADKEVVLTFDDGPLPRYSNKVLDILAAQCVRATYFLVGEMARDNPAVVRRIYEAGHTIGTHSEDHPSHFDKLPIEKVRQEIDEGIADVGAALGDPEGLAPFFRIPGLARSDEIEDELAARSLIVFSSDTVADDWHRRIRPRDIVARAMTRLEKRGKGILLLHDIHAATVAALPELLKKLKEAGFHVVHVVPAPTQRIEIAGDHDSMPPEGYLGGGVTVTWMAE
jgi:peptidoglycan-N-acetylglucosamine deacetylase